MYPNHGISVGTIVVPSICGAILTLRRASLHYDKETQTIFCHYVCVYFFLHTELIQLDWRDEERKRGGGSSVSFSKEKETGSRDAPILLVLINPDIS